MNKKKITKSKDSDLVRLTRAFEELKQEIAENDAVIAACSEQHEKARTAFAQAAAQHRDVMDHLMRARSVLNVQFTNLSDMIERFVLRGQSDSPFIAVDVANGGSRLFGSKDS